MSKKHESQPFDLEGSISKSEEFIKQNQKSLLVIAAAVLVIVGGYFAYQQFWVKPQEDNARKEMFMAERYYDNDSLNLALNGDGNYPGFLQIIGNYGSSKSANLAYYYAGTAYLRSGEYDKAIEYLKKYDGEDDITGAIALGCIGDAYLEKDNRDEALAYYRKAYEWDDNQFTASIYMMKAAMVYELKDDWKQALSLYEKIKKEYPNSTEARDVEKYIARARVRSNT
ncbi:MAG: tetratricopeptide repeat protein [Bacteroidia bacterium]|nr:tetratricopeptide repeat protein [Bacteroidia bacterium]MCZ2276588.1 tetratricopeptide repeat protein [Bacteroidia bacterium]